MQHPSSPRFSIGCFVVGALLATSCSVNGTGLGAGGETGSGVATGGKGVGGAPASASGGRAGTGGIPAPANATGGARATTGGSGGAVIVTTGGAPGTGGEVISTGGDRAATGGAMGTGGMGTDPAGTGGSMVLGTGGANGACNATTCPTGCCNQDRCVNGTNINRCGTAGAACVACGACFTCSAGACTLTPTSRWNVICVDATIAPTKLNGQPWDVSGTGLPDPICRSVTPTGATDVSTGVQMDNLSPNWDEPITPTAIVGSGNGADRSTASNLMSNMGLLPRWGIAVIDNDGGAANSDIICAVLPRLTPADFAAGTTALPAEGSCLSLNIRLECAE